MAPVKKSKSLNKGLSAAKDSSITKDDKHKQKKRKTSDMLGSKWRKSELRRFYDAYRKYGFDWKKVSVAVRSRSVEMVEALFNTNKAYLSLPEKTRTVDGLIAMMIDHYHALDGSGSDKDTEETAVVARKVQKHLNTKSRPDTIRESSFQHHSISSRDRGPSLLKMFDGIQPSFPVRKRTPRLPISSLDNRPRKKSRGSVMNANDEELSNGMLMQVRQNQHSPHGSKTSNKFFDHSKSPRGLGRDKHSQSPSLKPKCAEFTADEESADGSLGSSEARIGNFSKDSLDSDEQVACDALKTLAEMSLMMPGLAEEQVKNGDVSRAEHDSLADKGAQFDLAVKVESSIPKKKRKPKVRKAEPPNDSTRRYTEKETKVIATPVLAQCQSFADEEVKSGDSSAQITAAPFKLCNLLARSPTVPSSSDLPLAEIEVAVSIPQIEAPSNVVIPMGRRSRHKRDRMLLQKDRNLVSSVSTSKSSSLVQDSIQCAKDKILHCLSRPDVRRWCIYEWFYSAIDYPWFAKKEFVEYLNHVGLGHIPRLTRDEWGVIRNSLGKPRRFSDRFLQEERGKLKNYRESVRSHYANLRAGLGEGLPTDLARPLAVGQQVVAIHPKTREVHNGCVLTVDRQTCLVQFDRSDLGVESVMDIDCMPLNPVENMPESLRRQKVLYDYRHSQLQKVSGAFMLPSNEQWQNMGCHPRVPQFSPSVQSHKVGPVSVTSQAKVMGNRSIRLSDATKSQYPNMAQMHPGKGDTRPVTGLTPELERKVISQPSESHRTPSCWPLPVTNFGGFSGTLHSSNNSMFNCQETPANVVEIVEGSKEKAQKMVDVAIKAISSMREGDDAYGRIGEALDPRVKVECATNGHMPSITMSSNRVQGRSAPQNSIGYCSSDPQLWVEASSTKPATDSAASDRRVPSDLISSCVATLLMIQTCTERQYPPAEVAQILDNAVTNLHPCCSQNLSIYREIEMCMGRIKTQILALVPT